MSRQLKNLPILLVDDEIQILRSYEITLRMDGYTKLTSNQDSRATMDAVRKETPSLVLLDLTMPNVTGEKLLADIKAEFPYVPVVIVTGNDAVESAVECMKNGAEDYLVKPVSKDRLLRTVERVLRSHELYRHVLRLENRIKSPELENPDAFSHIVTGHSQMHSLFRYAEAIAGSFEPVLITGETGVGKELMACAIYRAGGSRGPFVAVNIAGLSEQVFDDTLFGHRKGAFTGADRSRGGLVEKATGGTLFLDEIGDLSPASQVKLLRLIQEGEYLPLGEDRFKTADVRLITATNQNLEKLMETGTFRKDLFYRLHTHTIALPPLRERICDVPLLIDAFLREIGQTHPDRLPLDFQPLLQRMAAYSFPGNVRELRSMVFDASASGSLDALTERLGHEIREDAEPLRLLDDCMKNRENRIAFPASLPTIEAAKDMLIAEALRRCDGNKSKAAKILGMTRQALNKRLRKDEMET